MAWMARLAEVEKLESILRSYLFAGIKASRMRYWEEDMGPMTLTNTVRLHPARKEDKDFKLEVWLCSSIGNAISEAKMRLVEDLRTMLGDYLFKAMKTSNQRKEEERIGMLACTSAVDVSFPSGKDSSDNSKLEVTLNFEKGWYVLGEAYPS
ncbi:hypothetical protein K469DRAFT_766999 [Zopfia rhizophila CBS 207.26]|uniref:Uncharacterized protein n=1 Tax=Zopfia rhizophila CBS 207.26 TaxID=1314779 RepID=A0A6A6D7X1_9PEZI|nr:hypothetical protein K469DRAFT_770420 [Zopfia rhizophila CBS 207.26]KAF2175145.1 hypothetical protein K469DRAFT_766999 [Zopfia rhizophila CBS 207.26]